MKRIAFFTACTAMLMVVAAGAATTGSGPVPSSPVTRTFLDCPAPAAVAPSDVEQGPPSADLPDSGTLAPVSCGVLLIWDDMGSYTPNLVSALQAAGMTVTLSATDKNGYTGANPSPYGFGCVILLDGTTYGSDMPVSGQQALVAYVQNGGGFIETEWAAYDLMDENLLQYMRDLILFDRVSGWEAPNTYTLVSGMGGHPVMAGVPASFSFQTGYNIGPAHTFATNPVTVLMRDSMGSDAVAVRQFGAGHVVGFNHAGNYYGYNALSDANIQKLFVNAASWSCSGGYDLAYLDDFGRSRVCANSKTGAWQYTVLTGAGKGVYSGKGSVSKTTDRWTFRSQAGSPMLMILTVYQQMFRATASLGGSAFVSQLSDRNTKDDPPGCQ